MLIPMSVGRQGIVEHVVRGLLPRVFRLSACHLDTHDRLFNYIPVQVKKKGAEKPKEYAELQAKYAKMQEMDMARSVYCDSNASIGGLKCSYVECQLHAVLRAFR